MADAVLQRSLSPLSPVSYMSSTSYFFAFECACLALLLLLLLLSCVSASQHRDLKLDNILTDSTKEGADVKLVDFGLSAHFEDFKLEHDIVGTWVSECGLAGTYVVHEICDMIHRYIEACSCCFFVHHRLTRAV